ncbi:hypothetical protein Tco_1015557 [Tanacetum coccineum]|uniref:Uncharacterized protein n=1 Tax=Tanacetum coccineum TaxID=301880 RepID=A0ABQ5FN01_9ASTR
MFGKETFKATDNKVEINLDAAKELAEKKEFRRAKEHQAIKELAEKKEFRIAKKELNRRMEEQFTKLGAPTARPCAFTLNFLRVNGSVATNTGIVYQHA